MKQCIYNINGKIYSSSTYVNLEQHIGEIIQEAKENGVEDEKITRTVMEIQYGFYRNGFWHLKD